MPHSTYIQLTMKRNPSQTLLLHPVVLRNGGVGGPASMTILGVGPPNTDPKLPPCLILTESLEHLRKRNHGADFIKDDNFTPSSPEVVKSLRERGRSALLNPLSQKVCASEMNRIYFLINRFFQPDESFLIH